MIHNVYVYTNINLTKKHLNIVLSSFSNMTLRGTMLIAITKLASYGAVDSSHIIIACFKESRSTFRMPQDTIRPNPLKQDMLFLILSELCLRQVS